MFRKFNFYDKKGTTISTFSSALTRDRKDSQGTPLCWTLETFHSELNAQGHDISKRTVERTVLADNHLPAPVFCETVADESGRAPKRFAAESLLQQTRREHGLSLYVQLHETPSGQWLIAANDGRGARRWVGIDGDRPEDEAMLAALRALCDKDLGRVMVWPHGDLCARLRRLADADQVIYDTISTALAAYHPVIAPLDSGQPFTHPLEFAERLSHLDRLEAESIHILREVVASADNPVMLYSIGKDSALMLHLAKKAFHPAPPPFPLLHIDTGWKFQEMIQFRDQVAADAGMRLITHTNPEGLARNINPIDHGSAVHTDIMKTQGLCQALDEMKFDMAFGGARRDEEKSRAKERVFSFRNSAHLWDPKNQRPELWNLYNSDLERGENIRVFPVSNWTELDVWLYILRERISVVPLYFAATRPVVVRDGMLLMLDDDRLEPMESETVSFRKIRFRTLGCYPLTGAIESDAEDLEDIILELLHATSSERQGRAIDSDSAASMEKKKREGYF